MAKTGTLPVWLPWVLLVLGVVIVQESNGQVWAMVTILPTNYWLLASTRTISKPKSQVWMSSAGGGGTGSDGSSSRNNNNNNNSKKNDDDNAWDKDVDYEKEWPNNEDSTTPDPSTAWNALPNMPESAAPKLGIGIRLEPLSEQDAKEIKEQAKKVIDSEIDKGIQDLERLRKKMNKELDQSRKIMNLASELQAKQKSEELMNKIDSLTNTFLEQTKATRETTKLAAAASRSMEGTNRGIEMGTWGTLGGRTVLADTSSSTGSGLLGSVEQAIRASTTGTTDNVDPASISSITENRIVMIADTKQDPIAKQLVPILLEKFEKTDIPNLLVDVLSPTSTMPLGGNNAACVIVFCTSLSQASSLQAMLDRLLRKTLQTDGKLGRPPTQLVGISTVGTERTDKFPYSLYNMMGGKLDQRRQIEEVLINTVKRRVLEPSLDYTVVKLGEVNNEAKEFSLKPGDVLDDPIIAETASDTIIQAVAYQPLARNSTFSVSGAMVNADADDQLVWEKAFLVLEGPEVLRLEDVGVASQYGQLLEYVQGWGNMLAETGKGLTTPVQAFNGIMPSRSSHLVQQQDGVELLFLPTKTGRNYMSRKEELQREQQTGRKAGTAGATMPHLRKKAAREGGIDIVVEVTNDNHLRVRARRCNYGDDTIVKELSEETILKRLEEAMNVWKKEHMS